MDNVGMPCGNWPIEIFRNQRMNHSDPVIGAFGKYPEADCICICLVWKRLALILS
jgi:hypothetical protein